jgi:hypothetical protein
MATKTNGPETGKKKTAAKTTPMRTAKSFRVLLEQNEGSTATAITIPFDVPEVFGTRARVPVRGTVNGFPFRTSLFPMGGRFIMVVNRETRAGAGVKGGDTINVSLERDTEPRIMEPPADLARALKSDKDAASAWDKLSYTHKKEFARAIETAKKPETRRRRIEKAVAELVVRKK